MVEAGAPQTTFESLKNSYFDFYEEKIQLMDQTLEKEITTKQAKHGSEAQEWLKKFENEVITTHKHIDTLRAKIDAHIKAGPGNSFLKSELHDYLSCLPKVNLEKMQKLLDYDRRSCSAIFETAENNKIELVCSNFAEFLEEQKSAMDEFAKK